MTYAKYSFLNIILANLIGEILMKMTSLLWCQYRQSVQYFVGQVKV